MNFSLSWTATTLPHRRNNFYFTAQSRRTDICCSVSKWIRLDSTPCSQRHADHRESNSHTRNENRVDCGIYTDSALRDINDACKEARARRSRIEGHDDHEATTRSCDENNAGISFASVTGG